MKLRIESDGTLERTRVLTEDGQVISGVQMVTWSMDAYGESEVTLILRDTGLDFVGEAQVTAFHTGETTASPTGATVDE